MATIQLPGTVRNGVVELAEPLDPPDGTKVVVTVPETSEPMSPELEERIREMMSHPAVGMWADREDMADSAEWVRQQRAKWRERVRPPE